MRNALFKALGGFWFDVKEVRGLIDALLVLQQQIDQEVQELENAVSRHTIDVYRKRFWYPLDVSEAPVLERYDSGLTYDSGTHYDQGTLTRIVTLPKHVISAEAVTSGVAHPEFTAEVTGRTLEIPPPYTRVWLKNALLDFDDLYTQFGYALGLKLPSSQQYKDLINALMDALVNGPSEAALLKGISAITGTDTNNSIFTWDIPALRLDSGFTGFCDDITFQNRPCAVHASQEDGFTRVDIDTLPKAFLDVIHTNGIRAARRIENPCELFEIQKILTSRPPVIEPPQPVEPFDGIYTGLGNYRLLRRFM